MSSMVSLVFTGDIGFDRYMDGQWNDEHLLSDEILDFLKSADHVIANVEGPVVEFTKNETTSGIQQLLHTINPKAVRVLRKINADIWNICNNHIMDAGQEGLAGTLREAAKNNVRTIGAGMNIDEAVKPVYIDSAGGIGIFGVGYQRACRAATADKGGCFSWSDMDRIRNTINEIKKKCRWCVIVSHGGEEFTALPSPYTRQRYLDYLEMGADIVVCHHPHVPMNYETRGDKAIFYSLGNFIFDTDYQRVQYNTDIGVLLKINFTEDSFDFEPLGVKILRGSERIICGELPRIFCDVQEDEYELLSPLSAKMFIMATKRQQTFLFPEKFTNASEKTWQEHFLNPKRSGRVPAEALDFAIICPLAYRESEKAWKLSKLEQVKEYILEQME